MPQKLEFSRATRNKIAFAGLTPDKRSGYRGLEKTPSLSDPDSFIRDLSTGPTQTHEDLQKVQQASLVNRESVCSNLNDKTPAFIEPDAYSPL